MGMESSNNSPVSGNTDKREVVKTGETSEVKEISPAIKQYFVDMGPEKATKLLSGFSKEGLQNLKEFILKGNIGYVVHLMSTAQMEDSGYSYNQAVLDYTSMNSAEQEKGGKTLDKFLVGNFETAAKYEKHDPSLSQGASEILNMLFESKRT